MSTSSSGNFGRSHELASEAGMGGVGGVPVPFGNLRDALSFYTSLVPRQRTAVAPKALVPMVDTVLLAKGKLTRWLCTGEGGEASEKLSTDREALLRVFKANGELPLALGWARVLRRQAAPTLPALCRCPQPLTRSPPPPTPSALPHTSPLKR